MEEEKGEGFQPSLAAEEGGFTAYVPALLSGKTSEVTVDAITSKGESFGSGSCMVNVSGAL